MIEFVSDLAVLEFRIPQGHQEAVFVAVHDLLVGKGNVDQVSSQAPGEGFFQEAQIFFRLLLGHIAQGFVQVGNHVPAAVDITAVNTAYGVLFRPETAAKLANFFQIHWYNLTFLKQNTDFYFTGNFPKKQSQICRKFRASLKFRT